MTHQGHTGTISDTLLKSSTDIIMVLLVYQTCYSGLAFLQYKPTLLLGGLDVIIMTHFFCRALFRKPIEIFHGHYIINSGSKTITANKVECRGIYNDRKQTNKKKTFKTFKCMT